MKDIDIQYIVGHGCTQYHVLGEEPFAIMCDSLILTIPIIFFLTRNNPFLGDGLLVDYAQIIQLEPEK